MQRNWPPRQRPFNVWPTLTAHMVNSVKDEQHDQTHHDHVPTTVRASTTTVRSVCVGQIATEILMPTEVRSSPTKISKTEKGKKMEERRGRDARGIGVQDTRRRRGGKRMKKQMAGRVSCYIGYFQRSLKLCLGQVSYLILRWSMIIIGSPDSEYRQHWNRNTETSVS